MVSFQHVGLEILDTAAPDQTAEALAEFGLGREDRTMPPLPHRPSAVLPELHARLVRAALEQTGATVAFTEVAA